MAPAKVATTSIVQDISALQTGLGRKSIARHRGRIIKRLLTSPCRDFKQMTHFSHSGPSTFTMLHYDRFFMQQKEKVSCFSAFKGDKKRDCQKLYKFKVNSQCKDLIIWSPDSPLSTQKLLTNNARHTTSLLFVSKDGDLVRRCALTGKVCDTVFLSPTLKFTEVSADPESDTVVVKTTRHRTNVNFITFAIFSTPPLEFTAMMEISKEIFSKKAVDAGIQQGLLFVRQSDDVIKLYSLEHILERFTVQRPRLGERLGCGDVVGSKPAGLPLTVHITEEPPVLMEVKSSQGEFAIGANPWHFMFKIAPEITQIQNLANYKVLGRIETDDSSMETESVFFHPDDSNRVIHLSNLFLKVFWLGDSLKPWLHYDTTEYQQNEPKDPPVSRYGRPIKVNYTNMGTSELTQDLTLSYESDSNLMALLRSSEGKKHPTMDKVLFFDNVSGEIVRDVDLHSFSVPAPFENSTFDLMFEGVTFLALSRYKNITTGLLCALKEKQDMPP